MMILYADDDNDDREILFDAFHQIDPTIHCCGAENGLDALDFLCKTKELPDYIFLDLNMPVMDGKRCLFKLKENAVYKHIPIIIYSTTIHQEEMRKLYMMGAASVIQKPRNLTQLRATLPMILNLIKNRRELTTIHDFPFLPCIL